MNRQIRRLGVGIMVLYLALFVQLNVVQVLRADEYNEHPANRRTVDRDFNQPRGQIVAADGTVLARSVPVDAGRFELQREYPTGDLFGPITGYFSFETGTDGVERTYNDALAGREVATSVGSIIDLLLDEETTADVTLTIPTDLQQLARDQLGERRGSVVAVDPRDGALLALWNFPSYDPNPLSSVDLEEARSVRDLLLASETNPLLPRTFRETFFPGSTFKVVTAGTALQNGTIDTGTTYPVETGYVPPLTSVPIRNFGGGTCGGNLFDLLEVSCNTGFARMGVDMGAATFVSGAEAFGFNAVPPLDLPQVARSTVADADSFEGNTPVLAQSAIGQNAVRSTPLQMALVAAAIANGGSLMTPHVMADIRDREGDVIRSYEPEEWRRVLDPSHAATLRDAMVRVVDQGTATRLQVPGVPTAGKTGTAQVGSDPPASHAWIIGFAPADAPRVAVAVVVEGQPGLSEQTGGTVAAPIARAVLEAALAHTE